MSSFSRPLFPTEPPSDSQPPAQIRLFVAPDDEQSGATEGADESAGQLTPDVTLEEFYQRFFQPVRLTGASPRTLKEDRATLAKWKAFAGRRPIGSIDRALLSGFLPWLQQQPPKGKPLGLVTAAKHLARVQTFLRAAGPDRDGDDEGLFAEILSRPPKIKPPALPTRDEPDKAFSLREIGSWLDACQHAAPMRRVQSPPSWWQSIVLFDYCCPLRFETLTAARWEWLYQREDLGELPGWWIKCPPGTDKNDCERRYYVSSHAINALEIAFPAEVARLRSVASGSPASGSPASGSPASGSPASGSPASGSPVSGSPVSGPLSVAAERATGNGPIFGLPITPARIYTHAQKILERSSINAARREERVFHGLRAACDTELRKLGFAIAAKRALGRSVGRDVDMGFYTGISEYVAGMEKLPQPTFSTWREPQLRLF